MSQCVAERDKVAENMLSGSRQLRIDMQLEVMVTLQDNNSGASG